MRALAMVAVASLWTLLIPSVAHAEKVKFEIKVVEASTQGNTIDPKLAHMRDDFKHKGFAYSSYKLVNERVETTDLKNPVKVPLPNGKEALLTPLSVAKDGNINVHIEIKQLIDVTYTVGNNGTYFQGAGTKNHNQPDESQIFLIIKHSAG
jgi:hypothetical protein